MYLYKGDYPPYAKGAVIVKPKNGQMGCTEIFMQIY